MINGKVRILIVDDSAFMRKSLSLLLASDPDIEIIGQAKNGLEGVKMAKELLPDVITLDIEMPVMDGLTALKQIMIECPAPVLMISSLTTEGADSTLKALELGAVDFIPKEMSFVNVGITAIKDDLIRKVKTIARRRSLTETLSRLRSIRSVRKSTSITTPSQSTGRIPRKYGFSAIAIGISTGGPLSLQKVIPILSPRAIKCPVFIVQHMPPKFTKSLADRLNDLSEIKVKEAEHNDIVEAGTVYLAPGGYHMTVRKKSFISQVIEISENPSNTLHRPSVDVMMTSVVETYGRKTLGVIMTGMGKDGLEAIKLLKSTGGYSIAQDEDSCVVYGMPKAIVDANLADEIISLQRIAETINAVV